MPTLPTARVKIDYTNENSGKVSANGGKLFCAPLACHSRKRLGPSHTNPPQAPCLPVIVSHLGCDAGNFLKINTLSAQSSVVNDGTKHIYCQSRCTKRDPLNAESADSCEPKCKQDSEKPKHRLDCSRKSGKIEGNTARRLSKEGTFSWL